MGKISSQVSKGLGAAIQEVKNKISDDINPEELLNSGAETQKKRHRRTKAEIQAEKEAKAIESQDNSLFKALDINEESQEQEEEVEDNRPEWEKRSPKDNDEFCEWELEKAKLKGLENPEFDFRNFYEKGQTIYYIHILRGGINTKELKKLKIRTIYPRMMICNEEKACCQCICYNEKDLIFYTPRDADVVYKSIDMISEEELEKAKSGKKNNNGTVEDLNEENSEYEAYTSLEEIMNNEED